MMIQSPAASDPSAGTASLGPMPRSPDAMAGDTSSGGGATAAIASPDVIVTLGQATSAPDTYDASGRMVARPTPENTDGNSPDSPVQATESIGKSADPDSSSMASDAASANVGQDAAVPA